MGKGLLNEEIEMVVYSWQQVYLATGLQMLEHTYLVLKDGTVRDGLPPVRPSDFDYAAEKRAEPDRWGRWQRHGGDIQVSFKGQAFTTPPQQLQRLPGKLNERFSGEYEGAASTRSGFSASSWSQWALVLKPDGRFRRWSSGGAGGSTGFGDQRIATGTVWNGRGSSSAASGPNFGGGSSSTSKVTDSDINGAYKISGWSLELQYDNGGDGARLFLHGRHAQSDLV